MYSTFLVLLPPTYVDNEEAIYVRIEELATPYLSSSFDDAAEAELNRLSHENLPELRRVAKPMFDYFYVEKEFPASIVFVSKLPPDFVPNAVLTPDGVMHGNEKYNTFVYNSDDPYWLAQYRRVLSDYPDHLAVEVGCHH